MANTQNCLHIALAAYQSYQEPIRPYLLVADTSPVLRQLFTKSYMQVLIQILSWVNINDSERPVVVRIEYIATLLGIDKRTVDRALLLMKKKGFIKQKGDGRDNYGQFANKEFFVCDALREIVGLPIKKMSCGSETVNKNLSNSIELPTKSVDNFVENTEMSCGVYGVNVLKEDLKEDLLKKPEKPKSGMPADLVEMQEATGIWNFGIFALMKFCKMCNKRLQDVWIDKKAAILKAGVHGGRAFLYIKAIILSKGSFKNGKNVSENKQIIPSGNLSNDNRRYWHKRYVGKNGLIVQIFDGIAEIWRDRKFLKTILAGELEPIYEDIKHGRLKEVIQ